MLLGQNSNYQTNTDREVSNNEAIKNADLATICVYGLSILSALTFIFLPLVNILNSSPWQRWMGGLHGMASMLAMIVIGYAGHLAFPLLRKKSSILSQVRTLSFWSTIIAFLAVVSGIWCYTRYRAPMGGARAWLIENTPLVHFVYMEYHEFTVLFTIPLGVACTWIAWRYGDSILETENKTALYSLAIGLMLMMFFAIGGFVSGLSIAKTHGL